jgi:RNA polymerase sigma-70 factor, ECF subfamily
MSLEGNTWLELRPRRQMGAADRPNKPRHATAECVPGAADAALAGPLVRGSVPETETASPTEPLPDRPRSTPAPALRAARAAPPPVEEELRKQDGPPEGASAPAASTVPEDEDRALTFEQIVFKYEKKIFNLILRCIGDREEAEDLTQETFVNAYKSFNAFRGECKIHTWLCQIALNQCKNRFRQRDRRRTVEGPSLDAPSGGSDEALRPLEIPDWDQSPQEVLIRNETYRYVLKAIRSLPDEYRTVIILCDLQQMSYQQIAQITSLSLEAVKTRIHRGRLMLRRKVEAYLRS